MFWTLTEVITHLLAWVWMRRKPDTCISINLQCLSHSTRVQHLDCDLRKEILCTDFSFYSTRVQHWNFVLILVFTLHGFNTLNVTLERKFCALILVFTLHGFICWHLPQTVTFLVERKFELYHSQWSDFEMSFELYHRVFQWMWSVELNFMHWF